MRSSGGRRADSSDGCHVPGCDPLVVPTSVHELGLAPLFPIGSLIHTFTPGSVNTPGCYSSNDNGGLWNATVQMINQNAISFSDVWYVAQPDTSLTNIDGTVNGMLAFKIDDVGDNRPLRFESILADGIFAPGEVWSFIIQDYVNGNNLAANALRTIGVPTADQLSSGNIIAIPVPEPAGPVLLGVGLLGFASWRRVRA